MRYFDQEKGQGDEVKHDEKKLDNINLRSEEKIEYEKDNDIRIDYNLCKD